MSGKIIQLIFATTLIVAVLAENSENAVRSATYEPDIEPYEETGRTERSIFDYRKNGIKVDVRIVPAVNRSNVDDKFPPFPFREIGGCVMDFSMTCIKKRIARFLDTVGRLPEITFYGQTVKLVRVANPPEIKNEQRMLMGPNEWIDRSIDNFFDTFALRLSFPRRNGKQNQIDIMMDDTNVVEGLQIKYFNLNIILS